MKAREGKGHLTTDLLLCFPSRAHLTLLPKAICSPSTPSEPFTRKSSASPLSWPKTKPNSSADISEPNSPKVTCAGKIKVRTKATSCKNWQSVMEEIERLHNNRKHKKRHAWTKHFGFKKMSLQFLTCLRGISFRCFHSFPTPEITYHDDEDEDDDIEQLNNYPSDKQASIDVFSKWFMILQENNLSKEFIMKTEDINSRGKVIRPYCDQGLDDNAPCVPPPNALLLMRCRSAPARNFLVILQRKLGLFEESKIRFQEAEVGRDDH
ncbi:hypothetical protein DH2020_007753 [Rehmannia glutinosa]|uniref:Uncharacterized protein n=1 Tax=Rehmannia glutinosa TaxID=99300 RepID=A0ABR0TZD8_REHGL